MNLYINLTNFNDSKIAGVGNFMKRIFEKLHTQNHFFDKFEIIYIYYPSNINIKEVLSIPDFENIRFIKINFIHKNILLRILYEQFILPIIIKKNKSFYFSPNPVMPILIYFRKNVYTICTIHDLIPFFLKTKYNFIRTTYIKFITFVSAKLSNKIITVSNSTKNDLVKKFSINENKIVVIYNFVNFSKIIKCDENKDKFIVSICTIEPGKNIESMLKGFKEFLFKTNNEFKNFKYYIIGKPGWDFENIYKLTEKLELTENVIFTGYIPDDTKFSLLKNAVCLLFLSKYEGFGIPILEALYLNTPSIVLNNSSLPEVVGNSGIILNNDDPILIADAINEVLSNRDKYSNSTKTDILKFNSDIQINKFMNLFNTDLI